MAALPEPPAAPRNLIAEVWNPIAEVWNPIAEVRTLAEELLVDSTIGSARSGAGRP
jgi:hypothetical protein